MRSYSARTHSDEERKKKTLSISTKLLSLLAYLFFPFFFDLFRILLSTVIAAQHEHELLQNQNRTVRNISTSDPKEEIQTFCDNYCNLF